ncbi:MAG: protein kinase [Polyangiaceae bacterium]
MGVAEPRRIGRYDLLLPIASGGMGSVYLARAAGAAGFERDVALKLTHHHLRESATFVSEVLAEAEIASRIQHTNVVPVLDVGEDDLGVFLVMEYIAGDSLSGLIKKARETGETLPQRVCMRILVDALAGLHAAHELTDDEGRPQHVVHRDFSPQNILVGLDGVSRLTDFGIAKAASRASHTTSGVIKGKACYVAPEQAQDLALDRRCDVWAAGVVAWELLAGRRLYSSENEAAILLRIVSETPPRVSSVVADVPPAVDEAIARALTTDPGSRTPTAQAFAKDLGTATRAFGLLAEPEEVAEWVARLAGPLLERRKQQALEARRARGSDPRLRDAPAAVARESSPDLARPSSPDVERAPAPEVARESSPSLLPGGAPSVPSFGAATLARPADEVPTDTSAVSDRFGGVRRPSPFAIAAMAGAALSVLVLVVIAATVFVTRSTERRASAETSVDPAPAPASAQPTPPASHAATPASAAEPAGSAPIPTIEIFEATRATVELSASEPMAVIFVDGRTIRPSAPVSSTSVALEGGEQRRGLKVSAMTADGRAASAEITQYATTAKLTFPERRRGAKPKLAKNPFER